MSMFKSNYLIPDSDFASEKGKGGQVSHALGVLEGLKQNNVDVTLYAESNFKRFHNSFVEIRAPKIDILDIIFSIKTLLKSRSCEVLVIRKSIGILIVASLSLGLRLFFKGKIVWEVNGFSFHNERYKGRIQSFAYKLIIIVHKLVFKKSNLVYVVSEDLKEELKKGIFAVREEKIIVINNGGPKYIGTTLGNSKNIRLIYFGVFQEYNDFETIIKAFIKIRSTNKNIELHFVGYGPLEYLIKSYSNINGLFYWGPKTYAELLSESIISYRSIGLIPMNDENSRLRSPVKLYEYLSLGMPVLTTDKIKFSNDDLNQRTHYFYKNQNISSCVDVLNYFLNLRSEHWKEIKKEVEIKCNSNTWSRKMELLQNKINNS